MTGGWPRIIYSGAFACGANLRIEQQSPEGDAYVIYSNVTNRMIKRVDSEARAWEIVNEIAGINSDGRSIR